MILNPNKRITYSNILIKNAKWIRRLSPDMIIHKEIVSEKTNKRTGETEAVYEYSANLDFWKNLRKQGTAINVVIDEAHNIINSRRSMSSKNICIMDWLAMARRILGSVSGMYGELVFITQLPRRIDIVALEMARKISHVVAHYFVNCEDCGLYWKEDSEQPEQLPACPGCFSIKLHKSKMKIEVRDFPSLDAYNRWNEFGEETFYRHYIIHDIERYWNRYDSLQWENLFEQF